MELPLGIVPTLADRIRSLSPAEYRVFVQFKDGLDDFEIATALGLQIKSVKYHMQRVYAKFGIIGPQRKSRKLFAMLLKGAA